MYFEVYQDRSQEWRWRLKAANHQVVATSGEGYVQKASCLKAIDLVKSAGAASVKEV